MAVWAAIYSFAWHAEFRFALVATAKWRSVAAAVWDLEWVFVSSCARVSFGVLASKHVGAL